MKLSKSSGLVLGLLGLLIFSSCKETKDTTTTNSAPQAVTANKETGVVAKVLGKEITEQELYKGIEGDIYEAEEKLYDLKYSQLQAILLERFSAIQPDRGSMSIDEYIEKVVSKSISPSSAEIEKFIKDRDIPKEHISDELKSRISQFLERESKKKSMQDWLAEQMKKNSVEIMLKKPMRPVFNVNIEDAPSIGDANAKVTVVEFSDFQCPFCAKGSKIVEEVKKKYGDRVKIAFRNFPLPFHRESNGAAQAGLCAFEQGNEFFWKMHNSMFNDQQNLKIENLKEKAKSAGLKVDQFNKCLDEGKFKKRVEKEIAQGSELAIKATPTFYINGQLINGAVPIETFFDIIDSELNK